MILGSWLRDVDDIGLTLVCEKFVGTKRTVLKTVNLVIVSVDNRDDLVNRASSSDVSKSNSSGKGFLHVRIVLIITKSKTF